MLGLLGPSVLSFAVQMFRYVQDSFVQVCSGMLRYVEECAGMIGYAQVLRRRPASFRPDRKIETPHPQYDFNDHDATGRRARSTGPHAA